MLFTNVIFGFCTTFLYGALLALPADIPPHVRTVTYYQGAKQHPERIEYVDSFSVDGLKMRRIQMDNNNDTIRLLYTIYFEYDANKNVLSKQFKYPDHSISRLKFVYNDSAHSSSLLDSSMGSWQITEQYFRTAYGDTSQYLHYSNGQPNSGWKKEFTYSGNKKSSYTSYSFSFPGNKSTWKLNATVKYFYSSHEDPDSLLRYDAQGTLTGKDIFSYDKMGRLIKARLYNGKHCFLIRDFKYDKSNRIVYKKTTTIDLNGKKEIDQTKYKYNKQGFLSTESYKEHGRWHAWSSYSYTYY